MSRPSFLLLFLLVASLAAVAGFRTGGGRSGKSGPSIRYEAHATIVSLKDDWYGIQATAERLPNRIRRLFEDIRRDFESLAADADVESRIAVHHLATLVRVG